MVPGLEFTRDEEVLRGKNGRVVRRWVEIGMVIIVDAFER